MIGLIDHLSTKTAQNIFIMIKKYGFIIESWIFHEKESGRKKKKNKKEGEPLSHPRQENLDRIQRGYGRGVVA